ncbi:pyruvate formate-lyase activating enzyme-like uncharacterized protein [Symbiobacterium terraclitae]|uniref:Pyruvate formate-lyase activating enzyme-like uncharacterized protein n=1 Tax=Symbiobacterium terraclitae TaxID=557451 RepID=A0ABS4JV49_9FIRM|nr:pyruvate formate-lyase activating enzyme-like uncharacterized protein [Symbiobacterium terraclitae]
MTENVTRENLHRLRNPRLRAYAERYAAIYEEFEEAVQQAGLPLEPTDRSAEADALRAELRAGGTSFRNAGHSIHLGPISPACEACRKGVGTATFFASLKCHRRCFYCFNPNQQGYDFFQGHRRDLAAELTELAESGCQVGHLALTGGEPLLFPEEAAGFFQTARRLFPGVHTRLYTSGDHLNEALLRQLADAGLDEVRISVRVDDGAAGRRHTYDRIALAREYIPAVMVETPVLPGTLDVMEEMLLELDRIGIFGVNLLEFCFPFHNAGAFRERGYQIKNPPYEVPYDYWYAGGLPVAGSELDALRLLRFALDRGLSMGVHYCSLENKHSGQIYQQNADAVLPETACFSERDFFIRSAKVFGRDAIRARKQFDAIGYGGYTADPVHGFLEFHPARIPDLRGLDVEVALCTYVQEERAEGRVLRELKVALTTPESFDPDTDI